jgi:hypothetical protein
LHLKVFLIIILKHYDYFWSLSKENSLKNWLLIFMKKSHLAIPFSMTSYNNKNVNKKNYFANLISFSWFNRVKAINLFKNHKKRLAQHGNRSTIARNINKNTQISEKIIFNCEMILCVFFYYFQVKLTQWRWIKGNNSSLHRDNGF